MILLLLGQLVELFTEVRTPEETQLRDGDNPSMLEAETGGSQVRAKHGRFGNLRPWLKMKIKKCSGYIAVRRSWAQSPAGLGVGILFFLLR